MNFDIHNQCCHSVHKDGPKSILWTILTKMVHIWSIFSKFSPSFSFFMKTMTKVHILAKNSRKAVDINSPFFCMKRTIKVHFFAKNTAQAFYKKKVYLLIIAWSIFSLSFWGIWSIIWSIFCRILVRLLSGSTVYRYTAPSPLQLTTIGTALKVPLST
jgi:hypothetical protein